VSRVFVADRKISRDILFAETTFLRHCRNKSALLIRRQSYMLSDFTGAVVLFPVEAPRTKSDTNRTIYPELGSQLEMYSSSQD
jgi:hypothetical protein